jgi:transposase
MSTTYPSDHSDAEWTCVQRCLPTLSTRGRPRRRPLRRILDAIFYVLRSGCPWRYLPSNFPPWQTVLIVCTQMTTPNMFTGRRRGEDVVDLDLLVGDDDASNEHFDQLAALVEAGLR